MVSMRIIIQITNLDGTVTNTAQPLTAAELKAELAAIRYAKESAGITVGTQPVSTYRDEMPVWLGMLLDVQSPSPQESYEYKPRGGENVVLEPWEMVRAYQCFAWYTTACFATERYFQEVINAASSILRP
jgi:hypothetical protein